MKAGGKGGTMTKEPTGSLRHFRCRLCGGYAFNRFLGLLTNAALGKRHFQMGRAVHEITSAAFAHTYTKRAAECWQHPHSVRFAVDVGWGRNGAAIPKPMEFDLLALRHGPRAGTPILARQVLPYHLRWGS
jgi:hypothetical protein